MGARAIARRIAAVAASALALAALARGSAFPLRNADESAARLRLSWSARPERIEACRTLSEKELEEREEHMRQRVECEGRFATYALSVELDGRRASESVVQGAGLRHDRPIFLLRDMDLAPGIHRLLVRFARREQTRLDSAAAVPAPAAAIADTGLFAGRGEREREERARRAPAPA